TTMTQSACDQPEVLLMASRYSRYFIANLCLALASLSLGCSGAKTPADAAIDDDAPVDAPVEEAPPAISEAGSEAAGRASLTGTVTDSAGLPVVGAKVAAGGVWVFTDAQGKYALANLAPGATVVNVSQSWFQPIQQTLTLADGTPTPWNVTLIEMPLKVDPADRALATLYNQTFDWTKQTISISIVETPTRRAFDNAVYFHNPALYRDTSATPPLIPSPQPTIVAGVASGFTFPVLSGANQGQEALDLTTIVDSLKDTPFGATEPTDYMMWTPMVNWLGEWDAAKSVTLKVAGLAVRQQGWGGNAVRPQDIEKVFLDPSTGRLWVKVVFENFVQLGPGISDDDGDGRKEIYAALANAHYTAEIVNALVTNYTVTTFSTYALSKQVTKSLNEIYSTTGAQVERFIGQPFDVKDLGTIVYPYVVLKHAVGQENAILVAPAP
ncbi:MAG TPA: carboxypeptidase-like regulatory domain-containing protein, partial [Polyangia bacterium]